MKRYRLSIVDRPDFKVIEQLDYETCDLLIDGRHKSQAQIKLKSIQDEKYWVACSCKEGAMMFVRLTGDFLGLVRMPHREDHTDDCYYSEENIIIRRTKAVEETKSTSISFHKVAPEPTGLISSPNIAMKSNPAESSTLASYLLTVYQKANLNIASLDGRKPQLTEQYKRLRNILSEIDIAGKSGRDVVFTHPNDYQKAKDMLYKESWHDKQLPQVILFFTVDSIADKQLRIKVGDTKLDLNVKSAVEYVYDNASPPYNCMMTLCLRKESPAPEILRCVAIPILNKSWLLPVKNDVVRQFTYIMMEKGKRFSNRTELARYSLLTPFFMTELDGVNVRPDFYIDRDGAGYVALYFQSKRKDVNFDVRGAEMDYLRSIGIRVEVFDLDVFYTDITRALQTFVDRIFHDHLTVHEPEPLYDYADSQIYVD